MDISMLVLIPCILMSWMICLVATMLVALILMSDIRRTNSR